MLESGRYQPANDPDALAGFDVAVITVQTPLRGGVPDLSFIEEAGRMVGARLQPGGCVVLESTTYPGTTEEFPAPTLEAASGLKPGPGFALGSSPGRIDPGVGGNGLPVDPTYLSWKVQDSLGSPFQFVELANEINARMPAYVVHRLEAGLAMRETPLRGARVLLLGLAFKPDTADVRESPALQIATQLAELGAEVRAVDPHVVDELGAFRDAPLVRVPLTQDELARSNAVVLVTDHSAFDFAFVQQHAAYVLDARHRVPPGANVEYL